MVTKVVSLKNYRQNITALWREAKKNNVRYIVLYHSKPILEVRPYEKEEIIFNDDNDQAAYYKTLEQNLGFWMGDADDNIFSSQ